MRVPAILLSLLLIPVTSDSPADEPAASGLARYPNILFIAVDDLRPSLGCYGDSVAITPNIDRLAARGVRFDLAYCQVAVCNPSRASLMTGLRPDRLGVWTLPIHFREAMPDAVTLPQYLRRYGYTAVSHGKIFHNPTPDPQSWSEPIRPLPRLPNAYPAGTQERIREAQAALPADDWRKNNLRGPGTADPDIDDEQLVDGARTSMAIEDLRRLGKQAQPFFLAMGYIRPHLPWIAPRKYWEMHDPEALPVLLGEHVTANTPPWALSDSSELTHYLDLMDFPKPWDSTPVPESLTRHLMHGYYASVTYIDAQIGRLLDALDDESLADGTIVVLWSDHGWKLGEHNGWGKMSNYEIDTRVPLIIAAPGLDTAGQSTDDLAELLDLFPTLCDLAGVPIPDFVDGTSLAGTLRDPATRTQTEAFSQYYRRFEGQEYMGYAIRTSTHRFVEWRDFATGTVKARELYDHRTDHSESENLAADAAPELIDELTSQLLQSHPRIGLTMTPAVHSNPNPGRWPAEISFENQSSSALLIYPITPAGRRGSVRRVAEGQSATISARIGGVFVVENEDGTVHEIHSPAYPARTFIID